MRILIVGLNYSPEFTGVGKYTAEMAEYLGHSGHQVRVVTALPYYPAWHIQSGYRSWRYRYEEREDVPIYRAPLWIPREPSGIKRLVHLFSFALTSVPLLLWQMQWHPDLVLCIVPALFSAPFALLLARLCGAKSWLHIQDFELDAAINLGLLPSNNPYMNMASRGESWLLAHFDQVSTISNRMLVRLKEKGVRQERMYLFPNWVDTSSILPSAGSEESLRSTLGIPDDKIIVLYSGNMGHKQGLECIVEAATQLQGNPNIIFVLCGEGPARRSLERSADGLQNVRFLSLQPPDQLNRLLNTADIHIIPQKAEAADLVMPSKLLGMLASGKPVIATAGSESELGNVVSQIGMIVPPNDRLALSHSILELAESRAMRSELGEKGREYVCAHWNADQVLAQFLARLLRLVNQNPLMVD